MKRYDDNYSLLLHSEELSFHFTHFDCFSIRRAKVFVKIWRKESLVFQLFMRLTIKSRIVKFCVSFFLLLQFEIKKTWNAFFVHADILRQRTKDVEVKKYCIHLLEKLGSFEYTRSILKKLDGEARAEVSNTHYCVNIRKQNSKFDHILSNFTGRKSWTKQTYEHIARWTVYME